jgi:hypothetical protein
MQRFQHLENCWNHCVSCLPHRIHTIHRYKVQAYHLRYDKATVDNGIAPPSTCFGQAYLPLSLCHLRDQSRITVINCLLPTQHVLLHSLYIRMLQLSDNASNLNVLRGIDSMIIVGHPDSMWRMDTMQVAPRARGPVMYFPGEQLVEPCTM